MDSHYSSSSSIKKKKKNKLCVRNQTRFKKSFLLSRENTMLKKAFELSILCDNEICVLHYDREGNMVNTLPEDQTQVRDILERYNNLSDGEKIKKSTNLSRFLNKKLMDDKKRSLTNADERKEFREKIGEFKGSLVDQLLVFQDRVRFYSSQEIKHDESPVMSEENHKFEASSSGFVLPDDLSSSKSVCLPDHQSKFSMFLFNHETSTLTQLPNSVSSSFDQWLTPYANNLNTSSHGGAQGFNCGYDNSFNTQGFNNNLNAQGFHFGCNNNLCT